MSNALIHDVVIAGAGPVGLFLACELRLAGVSVLLLEQARQPSAPLKGLPFGMRGLSAPTVDALYRRGLLWDIATPPRADAPMQSPHRPAGHFAGIEFFHDNIYSARWPYRLPGAVPTNAPTTIEQIESVLAARASAMGADLRRGLGVDGVKQSSEGVTVRAGGETFRGRWLIGCDGGRSAVRKLGGFDFVGTGPEFTGYSVQVDLADPDMLAEGRHYTATGMLVYKKPGTIAMVDFDAGAYHRTVPISAGHVQSVLRRISGADVNVTRLALATTWTDRACLASAYRNGRVLLAGDAAHIHSPLGGQGLNLGLGDAVNLGWKLAATIRGDAPDGLLDTYCSERQPVASQILDWSRAQVALMRPDPGSRALAAIVRDLAGTGDGATYFAGRVWGVPLRYELGDSHDLVGRSAPDFALADGTRLGEHLRSGKGLLIDFDAAMPYQALASRWHGRIAYVASAVRNELGLSAVLVRPDGVVAWAGQSATDHDAHKALTRAASRWFGEALP